MHKLNILEKLFQIGATIDHLKILSISDIEMQHLKLADQRLREAITEIAKGDNDELSNLWPRTADRHSTHNS